MVKDKTLKFENKMKDTEDLVDLFTDLAEHLKEMTSTSSYNFEYVGATGTYIGRLEQTKKEIKEGDNDAAHVDEAGAQIVRYISATKDHDFMIGKFLKTNEGVTPDAFNAPEVAASGEAAAPAAEEGKEEAKKEEQKEEQKKPVDEIKNIVYRPEVTRESRMKFFKVPRLGCYLAVPLIYSSCLLTDSLDTALTDFAAYREKVKKNEEIMKEYQDKLAAEKAENEEEDPNNKPEEKSKEKPSSKSEEKSEEKAAVPAEGGETVPPEQKLEPPKLEEVKEPEYKTKPLSYVVCLDTLGQDRQFTPEQQACVKETIKKYKLQWEERERLRLTSDRKLREEEKDKDAEFSEKGLIALQEEEDKLVEEQVATIPEELGEEEKKVREKSLRMDQRMKQIVTGQFKERILIFQKYNVIKMSRIMQTLFYLLGYTKEEICEPETNKLFWKKAKTLWTEELLQKYHDYTPIGPKQGKYKKYQTINFLEKNLEGINEDDVKVYSLGLEKLFSCLLLTLEVRKADITRRKAKRERLNKEREEAIQKSEQRTKERAEELRVKKEEALNVFHILTLFLGLEGRTSKEGSRKAESCDRRWRREKRRRS